MPAVVDYEKYRSKLILAPMVRVGHLAMRLLALDYGADLVYSDEIIDEALLTVEQVENEMLKTTDFVCKQSGAIIFRTCEREKEKVILQLGAENPEKALEAAKLVEKHVSGIDINMGCPKSFSTKGGRGSALMKHPEKVKKLLDHLTENLSIPVTCKIRVFESLEKTLELVKVILSTNISALGVHGRTANESYTVDCRDHFIKEIKKISHIPIIANGFSSCEWITEDINKFKELTGADSMMIARKAAANVSVFSDKFDQNVDTIIKAYLEYAKLYEWNIAHVKYIVTKMVKHGGKTQVTCDRVLECTQFQQILDIWGIKSADIKSDIFDGKVDIIGTPYEFVKESNSISLPVKLYSLKRFKSSYFPKEKVNKMLNQKTPTTKVAKYKHTEKQGFYKSELVLTNGEDRLVFTSTLWNRSKKLADNATALVLLKSIEHYDLKI